MRYIESIRIIDDVTWEQAIDYGKQYGEVHHDIKLATITEDETIKVPDQEWHQDGSHLKEFPKYAMLWCEDAEDKCPSTEFISTRIPKELALKYKDVYANLDFKEVLDENRLFKFDSELDKRFYRKTAYKGSTQLVGEDEFGHWLRWCPFSSLDSDAHEEISKLILSKPSHIVDWKPGRLVISNNHATLHRRLSITNGHRILHRAYIP